MIVASPYQPYRVRSTASGNAATLKCASGGGTATGLYAVELQHLGTTGTLVRGSKTSTLGTRGNIGVLDGNAIRRLMPVECERLQGFPDGWTSGFADTPRYNMIGGAVMVPCAEAVVGLFPA